MIMVTDAGFMRCTPAEYHADPCPFGPSMSASNAEDMIDRSPRHAWHNHPRLNPNYAPWTGNAQTAEGAALHKLILNVGSEIKLIDAKDYRTNKAKDERDAAHKAGQIPILAPDFQRLQEVAEACQDQIAAHPDLRSIITSAGRAEVPMLWQDGATWCRSLTDYMPDDPAAPLLDFKFTTRDATPEDYERTVQKELPVRALHYSRGSRFCRDVQPYGYWLVVVETEAPFGMHVHMVGRGLLNLRADEYFAARDRWAHCLSQGTEARHWPSYQPVVNVVEPAVWQLKQAEAKRRYVAMDDDRDPVMMPATGASHFAAQPAAE